jgi:hypothetical protein
MMEKTLKINIQIFAVCTMIQSLGVLSKHCSVLDKYFMFLTKLVRIMSQISEEERQRILESSPVGTFALMAAVIGSMVVGWLFLYFGVFIPRGIIN